MIKEKIKGWLGLCEAADLRRALEAEYKAVKDGSRTRNEAGHYADVDGSVP